MNATLERVEGRRGAAGGVLALVDGSDRPDGPSRAAVVVVGGVRRGIERGRHVAAVMNELGDAVDVAIALGIADGAPMEVVADACSARSVRAAVASWFVSVRDVRGRRMLRLSDARDAPVIAALTSPSEAKRVAEALLAAVGDGPDRRCDASWRLILERASGSVSVTSLVDAAQEALRRGLLDVTASLLDELDEDRLGRESAAVALVKARLALCRGERDQAVAVLGPLTAATDAGIGASARGTSTCDTARSIPAAATSTQRVGSSDWCSVARSSLRPSPPHVPTSAGRSFRWIWSFPR